MRAFRGKGERRRVIARHDGNVTFVSQLVRENASLNATSRKRHIGAKGASMDEKNDGDPKPFLPPEGLQRCARPNFEYLDVKARSARNYRFNYLYDEY